MRLQYSLIAFIHYICLTFAFSNVAPLYSHKSSSLAESLDIKTKQDVESLIEEKYDIERLVVFQVNSKAQIPADFTKVGQVLYKEKKEINLALSKEYHNVVYTNLNDINLEQITNRDTSKGYEVLIQEVPTFKTEPIHEKVKEKLINLYNSEHEVVINKKRALDASIESDFKHAEELINENDQPVSILDTDKGSNNSTKPIDNLFTNYQFFTPGIFSGFIVSFLLLFILYQALLWLSSLEITYQSFEKPVDLDKKLD